MRNFRRLREEDGFTLIELLSAQIIGGFVIAAAISMLMIGFNSSTRITDRVNSAAQGRLAMEEIQQRLRSATCMYSTEYLVNSATQSTSASNSMLYASPSKIVFFTDIGNANSNTAATSAVSFSPQIRYLYFDPGPTTGTGAYRRGKWIDGVRKPTNTALPFVFNISPATQFTGMASLSTINSVTPETARAFAEGITAETTGATGTVPFFKFYDDNGVEVTATDASPVSAANIANIAEIDVTFHVLGLSGKDANTGPTATADKRTASFSNDIHLKTAQSACS